MNLDDYRAMIAQEKADAESKKEQPATPSVVETPVVTEEKVVETKPEESTPKLVIDGAEVTLDDVKEWKQGYLRTQDYTKKTQDVASQRKEAQEALELYNYLKANPQVAQSLLSQTSTPAQVANTLESVTPQGGKVAQLEKQIYDMMLQRELDMLQNKYPDFDVVEVLNTASEKNLTNLEDAYKLVKASKPIDKVEEVDADALKKQIRDELLKELEAERNSTTTIISTQTAEAPSSNKNEPTWSPEEDSVRIKMKMSVAEWAKWKGKK